MTAMLTSPRSLQTQPSVTPALARTPAGRAGSSWPGVLLTLGGFGGFTTWAALAPLASAAVAPGIVTADTNRKTVQHLDGGVIAEIAGARRRPRRSPAGADAVGRSGNPLGRDPAGRAAPGLCRPGSPASGGAATTRTSWFSRRIWPILRSDPEMAEILSGQERIFQSRRASLEGRVDVTRQRIAQYECADQGIRGPVHRREPAARPDPGGAGGRHGTDGKGTGT